MTPDKSLLRAFDTETYKILSGLLAPKIVIGSLAWYDEAGQVQTELLHTADIVLDRLEELLRGPYILCVANGAFDFGCAASMRPSLTPLIFKALAEGRVHDVQICQTLDAIYGGHLGTDPRHGGPLVNPATGETTDRYSLALCVDLVLGRTDAKDNAAWRASYALVEGFHPSRWPEDTREYPLDDVRNTLEVAWKQLTGWKRGYMESDEEGPARNTENLAAQVESAFALHLGACWSLRTDAEAVEKLALKVEGQHEAAVEKFKQFGWIRPDGTKDNAAVKRAVAIAYGVDGTCTRCNGEGTVRKPKQVECRGPKVKGRYQGCQGPSCGCSGVGKLTVYGDPVVCKASEEGCDGSGLDLTTQPMLPRTDKQGVRADRDTLMESGDDNLAAFGEDEFEKVRSTFIPYLRSGTTAPLKLRPNTLVASGRLSYEGSPFHQLTRGGGVRETIVARPGYFLGATDYEAGELCTLSQFCYWVFGYSNMRDAINASGKPGILHSELGASVIGLPLDEFLVRLKAKDKTCVDFRQASKPINFGTPGGMGSAKLVWTARKKNAGFTVCEAGPAVDDHGNPGYAGIRFCILVGGKKQCGERKINQWRGRDTFPVCKDCVEVVENVLRKAYFNRFPEIKAYFDWVQKQIDKTGRVPCLAWDEETQKPQIIRWRGGVDFPSGCNNGFQALLADVMKLAYRNMTRECYLGVQPDGTPSPLAGCHLPVVMHDEPISELIAETAHLSGPRIGQLMVEAGKKLAPDVAWVAETAICERLSKAMEPVYENGKLVPWKPKAKA
jgi:hypothetical protein